ncbi:MAG: AsmA family protein [Candidatus Omnitrophota bacterium]
MIKKIIIIVSICLFVLAILVSGGIIYLNNVFLPKTIRSLLVRSIEEQTNFRVSLGALRVNIFKGLVLSNLEIYNQDSVLVKIKEASCIFLPFPAFRKQIIIPSVNIKSAQVFLERREDKTFNLEDLFPTPKAPIAGTPGALDSVKPGAGSALKKGFQFSVYRFNISNARIIFRDATFTPAFMKSIENINFTLYLSLPASARFKLSALIASSQPMNLSAYGEYKIASRELNSRLTVRNFSPGDFTVYYGLWGLKIDGLLNADANFKMKGNALFADTQVQSKNLNIQQGKIKVKADISSSVILEYGLSDKKFHYSGSSSIANAFISGLKFVDTLSAVNCDLTFNNSGLSTENLTASIFGIPVNAKVALNDFNAPELSLTAHAELSLASLPGLLKDKFKFNFPGTIAGQGNLSLALEGRLKEQALARLDLALKSDTLSLAANLSLQDRLLKIAKCSGRYFASEFSIAGTINSVNPASTSMDLSGGVSVDLRDLKSALPGFKGQLEKINPEGRVKAQFNLSGKSKDPKDYIVEAQLSSDEISLYGLKGTDLFISYSQANGLANMEAARLSLYNGSLEAALTANLGSQDIPYWFTAALQGVEIKELKKDTLAKNKDISGIIQGGVKASGFLSGLADTQGAGRISITQGKLWELDLFKGMGKLLFSQEFANITFSEGACEFVIQDKAISTDELILKSSMVNLAGPVKIGFDSSINARFNIDIISELIPLTGTFKDIATALVSQGQKFAVITISGTLKKPRYGFQAAVTDIIKGLADTFLKKL